MAGKGPLGAVAQGQTHHWRAVGRVIPWWVARPQSPPLFHPTGGEYRPGACGARPSSRRGRIASLAGQSPHQLAKEGSPGTTTGARLSLALSVAMDRSFVVLVFGFAS